MSVLKRIICSGVWLALLAWTCVAANPAAVRVRRPAADRVDAGDGYRRAGEWVGLARMVDEWVVPAGDADVLQRSGSVEPALSEDGLPRASGLRLVRRSASTKGRRLSPESVRQGLADLRDRIGGLHANSVYADMRTGVRLVPRGQIVVCLVPGALPGALPVPFQAADLLPGTEDQFVLRLAAMTAEAELAWVSQLNEHPQVVWAEPDFLKEWRRNYVPNDPLFPEQWHLQNAGFQLANGSPYSPADVDIDAPAAWDRNFGSSEVVIAVIDDGVQAAHPDLQANIFVNVGEMPGNGLDDDGNGYSDDWRGWDFINNVNTPEPKVAGDGHGVATAGLAAARGDNSIGVSGVAPICKILPIKIFQGDSFVGSSVLANAIRYAAGLTSPNPWRGADILSMSFGGGAPTLIEDSAFSDAATLGRQGKGCVLVAATGNGASDYWFYSQSLSAGTNYFEWRYTKDSSVSSGEDTCRLGLVIFPNGTVERFDAPTPPAGWNFKPEANKPGWEIEDNPARAFSTGRYQARAQQIAKNNSYAICRSPMVTISQAASITFAYWISSESGWDFIEFRAVKVGEPAPAFTKVDSGVYPTDPYVTYPASHADVIAVGASSEFDYRSDFSQYGDDLDLVAPGGGGLVGIVTTDRTGADGYDASDYVTTFAGTSASTPIVAGAAALLLSRHPDLTAQQVRTLLRRTSDKVGAVTYTGGEAGAGGRNMYYGYGRLNAGRLLGLARVAVETGFGGLSATLDGATNLFCEAGMIGMLTAVAGTYFTFDQWAAAPGANADLFTPTSAQTMVAIKDDVTLSAAFSPMLAALGTPLYWLAGYGLDAPSFDAAELSDGDADGHLAWQEWQAGTDPTDEGSVLRVSSLERLPDGRCVMQWASVGDRVYDVLAFDTPDGVPTVLATGLAPTAPLNVYTSAPLPTASQFFRVRALMP